MDSKDDLTLVEVFAGTMWEAGLVKSMLEDAGIQTFFKDDKWGAFAPWHVAGGGAGAIKLMISNKDLDSAKPIMEQYYENLKER